MPYQAIRFFAFIKDTDIEILGIINVINKLYHHFYILVTLPKGVLIENFEIIVFF